LILTCFYQAVNGLVHYALTHKEGSLPGRVSRRPGPPDHSTAGDRLARSPGYPSMLMKAISWCCAQRPPPVRRQRWKVCSRSPWRGGGLSTVLGTSLAALQIGVDEKVDFYACRDGGFIVECDGENENIWTTKRRNQRNARNF
jgi:hypothetical protein